MATKKELMQLEEELKPIIKAAIDRGEDLSTPEHMQRFIERVLAQSGYAERGDAWVQSTN